MTDETGGFDAARFEAEIGQAGAALKALADGPGQVAAEALSRGFAAAGREIESALLRAAKTGEVSFDALFRRILDDLARVAAEAVIGGMGLPGGGRGGAPNVTFNLNGGGDGGLFVQQGRIGQMLASALAAGGRYR